MPCHNQNNVYVLLVSLTSGPFDRKVSRKAVSRTIEIRGDQTLDVLHRVIFAAFDRYDEHLYEFQFGKKPFDPKGPRYGIGRERGENEGDATSTTINDLKLELNRVFGYWFDFGDDWFHQIQVMKIDSAIPTVTYPRIVKIVGKSPPQYRDDDEE